MTYALLSVSDKTGIADFAQSLVTLGFRLLSTGGTFKLLQNNGIDTIDVSEYTGFAEIMDGRVKTLHPKIHGGILGRRGTDDAVMCANDIQPIDLVVVNLYPFAATIARADATLDDAIENIDIGGPAMIRAAAKNYAHVGIVTHPDDYANVLTELKNNGQLSTQTRFHLAGKAFAHTSAYDELIASFLQKKLPADEPSGRYPDTISRHWHKAYDLRYGENPHQSAAFYTDADAPTDCIARATLHQGKALSYNNIADSDSALECVKCFSQPACVIVKHANPCGVAAASDPLSAYRLAFATDPESAFGGIIAFNRPLDCATASAIIEQQFVEVIIAPSMMDGVLDILSHKKNIRLLSYGEFNHIKFNHGKNTQMPLDLKQVTGGLLVQSKDLAMVGVDDLTVVSRRQPTASELKDLLFAWQVAKYVKSNAIVYAANQQTLGIGAGQMSRVNSARIALIKAEQAGLSVKNAAMASDAFFPFRDGVDSAATAGIGAIIQPGGSVRDQEVIAAADEHGMAMVFTGIRHFRH